MALPFSLLVEITSTFLSLLNCLSGVLLLAILQGVEARTIQPVLSCPEHCENCLLITPGFHQGSPQAGGQWKTGVLALQVAAHPWGIQASLFPSLLGLPQTRTRLQLSVLLLGSLVRPQLRQAVSLEASLRPMASSGNLVLCWSYLSSLLC